jgi:hypothetical protein
VSDVSKEKDSTGWLYSAMWLLMLVPFLILAKELPELPGRITTERGIDAHPVELTATYAEFQEAPTYSGKRSLASDEYVLAYEYNGRRIRGKVFTPPLVLIGGQVCVEIDAERPERVRECGIDELQPSLHRTAIGSALMMPSAVYFMVWWRQRRRRQSAAVDERHARGIAGWTVKGGHAGQELVLRPATNTRNTATIVNPAFLGLFTFLIWAEGTIGRLWLVPLIAAIPLLAVRCWRAAILCADGTVTVRGFIFNRRIPANAVVAVTNEDSNDFPSIWWDTPSGRRRRTRLYGFWVGKRAGKRVLKQHKEQLARLRGWLKANRTTGDAARAYGTG